MPLPVELFVPPPQFAVLRRASGNEKLRQEPAVIPAALNDMESVLTGFIKSFQSGATCTAAPPLGP